MISNSTNKSAPRTTHYGDCPLLSRLNRRTYLYLLILYLLSCAPRTEKNHSTCVPYLMCKCANWNEEDLYERNRC